MPKHSDNMFACISQFRRSADVLMEHLPSHLEWLASLDRQGRVVATGAQEPLGAGGVMILTAANRVEMDELLQSDPFNVHGAVAYWVFEFKRNDAPYAGRLMEHFYGEEFNRQNEA